MPTWEQYLADHRSESLDALLDLCRIPSISALPERAADVQRAAAWLAAWLGAAGIEAVQVMPTARHPAVYGEWLHAPGKPTVLVYGHYDVQPVDPLDLWTTPPFEPTVRDGKLYARGATDNKGNMFAALIGIAATLRATGKLPINIKFCLEGQEEIGSQGMDEFIAAHREQFACDFVLNADAGQWSETEPAIEIGLRGLAGMQIDVLGAKADLHSGGFGGAIANPLHALAELVASMHTPTGKVAVAGFYEDVATLGAEERARIAAIPETDAEFLALAGAMETFGEPGYSTRERLWVRPTLEVNGMWGGFQGAGTKTVLPSAGHVKITCRLVPNQDPAKILRQLQAHIESHTPRGVKVVVHPGSGSPAYLMPMEHPGNRAVRDVLFAMYGREPYYTRSGGTVAICGAFLRELGAYSITFGFGLPGEQIHAPNEFYWLSSFEKAQRAWCLLLERLGKW
jgi:acetylornithine deacetylase/succinyl-diaminopimelate desuccinylase-like protein